MSDSNRHIVVYISAPLSAPTTNEWWDNTMDARKWCEILWVEGLTPICPHLNCLFMEGVIPYEEFIKGDLELVKRSDAVLMRGDWEDSKGAWRERDYALSINKPVFESMSGLFVWVEKLEEEQEKAQKDKSQEYNEEEL